MDQFYAKFEAVEKYSVNDIQVREEVQKILAVVKNPKLVKDQYEKRLKDFEIFPPPSPPNSSPARHPTDPGVVWVNTQKGTTLKIQARYRHWDETCFITKVSLASRKQ